MLSYATYTAEGELLEYLVSRKEGKVNSGDFNDWVRDHEALKTAPEQVNIIWSHAHMALIPDDYYQSDKRDEYLSHLFEPQPNQKLLEDESSDKHMFFPVNEDVYYAARTKFAQATHHSAVLKGISFAMENTYLDHKVVAMLDQDHLTLVHSEDDKLQFANSFSYTTFHEAAYFVLNYYETSGLNREKLPLVCYGVDPKSELADTLKKYLSHCQLDHKEADDLAGHTADLPLISL